MRGCLGEERRGEEKKGEERCGKKRRELYCMAAEMPGDSWATQARG